MAGLRQPGHQYESIAVTADTTLTAFDIGKIFHNTGAAGAVTITLPDPTTVAGGEIIVMSCANQNLTVSCASVLITDNALTSTSVSLSTASHKIGGGFRFISNGTKWMVANLTFGTQTVTVA